MRSLSQHSGLPLELKSAADGLNHESVCHLPNDKTEQVSGAGSEVVMWHLCNSPSSHPGLQVGFSSPKLHHPTGVCRGGGDPNGSLPACTLAPPFHLPHSAAKQGGGGRGDGWR